MELDVDMRMEHTGSSNGLPSFVVEKPLSEMFKGSGASGYDELVSAKSGQLQPIVFGEQLESIFEEDRNYLARVQDEILKTFGLTMTDLADICKVSRKTPYNWRESAREINRRNKGMDRLFQLLQTARDWRNSGFVKPSDSLREPLVKGKSLYDLFLTDTIDNDEIQFLGARLSMAQLDSYDVSNPFE